MTTTKKERQLTFIKKVTCTPTFSAAILLTAKEATQIPVNRETDKPNTTDPDNGKLVHHKHDALTSRAADEPGTWEPSESQTPKVTYRIILFE